MRAWIFWITFPFVAWLVIAGVIAEIMGEWIYSTSRAWERWCFEDENDGHFKAVRGFQ
jgi:hypothetical protein